MRRRRRTVASTGLSALLLTLVIPAAQNHCAAQFGLNNVPLRGNAAAAGDDSQTESRLFVTDRQRARLLAQTRALFEKGDYGEGLGYLQQILDSDEDFFFPERKAESSFHSLKAEAQRLIAGLPSEARRLYESKYGAVARTLVDEALQTGNVDKLEEAVRRFFHTQAGYEATYLLGSYHQDRSQPLAAAMHFERLRRFPAAARRWEPMLSFKTAVCWNRVGMPERSRRALQALKDTADKDWIRLGDRRVDLFDRNEDAREWLAGVLADQPNAAGPRQREWTMFGGGPSRNAGGSPAVPLGEPRWQHSTIRDPGSRHAAKLDNVAGLVQSLRDRYRTGGFLALPAAHPLVVDRLAVFRTPLDLRAVDLGTGRTVWRSASRDRDFLELAEAIDEGDYRRTGRESRLEARLAQRLWRDVTAGTLSSDDRYVYAVEDPGLSSPTQSRRAGRDDSQEDIFNRLAAYELETGKLAFEAGGSRSGAQRKLSGTWFLGPPLPLGEHLYCLGERSGEVRLLVLNPDPEDRTVDPVWSQSLILPEAGLARFPLRRLSGISPAYGDGILVCPTTAGAVVAVDVARRMLLWGYRYPTSMPDIRQDHRAVLLGGRVQNNNDVVAADSESRWLDANPLIGDGRVVLTPRDSRELHCLNLADGAVAWKKPRGSALYAACIHDGNVVVVGHSRIRAFRLDDGKPAWKEPTPIAMPGGRGYRTGSRYHLPVSTGELVTIHLQSGRILARSDLPTGGRSPGNLVSAHGTVVAQTGDSVTAYPSLQDVESDIRQQLTTDADDPRALARRGELRLHQGQLEDGLTDLRRSLAGEPNARVKQMLVATLLEGLRLEFPEYRKRADEIEKLLADSRQRRRYLRLYAAGLQAAGEEQAAFGKYLELAGPQAGPAELEPMSGILSVRSDTWVRTRIAELYRDAAAEERTAMDRQIAQFLESARKDEDTDRLRKFLNYFDGLPQAGRGRKVLVERLSAEDNALELEFHLQRLRETEDSSTAAFATARLAKLLIDRGLVRQTGDLLQELNTKWKGVTCLRGKTGGELVEEWRFAHEEVARLLAGKSAWPEGEVDVEAHAGKRRANGQTYPVSLNAPAGHDYENWSLALNRGRDHLLAFDGNGTLRWQLPIEATERPSPNIYGNYARVHGHLVVAVLGNFFVVLDTLQDPGEPRILWTQDLYHVPPGQTSRQHARIRPVFVPGRGRKMLIVDPLGRPMGSVGLVNDEVLVYQMGTQLYAADPLSGDTLWVRRNVARGSRIFGNRDHLFVAPPESNQATVLKTGNGEYVTSRKLPGASSRLTTRGRHVVVWQATEAGRDLAMVDALSGETVWKAAFTRNAHTEVLGENELAVFEPEGRFVVLDLDNGNPLVDQRVEKVAEDLKDVMVLRSRERYVVLTRTERPERNNLLRRPKQATPGKQGKHPENDQKREIVISIQGVGNNCPRVHGYAYGFDRRTGRALWTTRIEDQAMERHQPPNLPVLVLAAQKRTYTIVAGSKPRLRNVYSVALLDKRTGEIVFEREENHSLQRMHLDPHPEQGRLHISFGKLSITLAVGQSI